MEKSAVRTSIDIPQELHRKLHEAAARKGCSARRLILAGIEQAVQNEMPNRPLRRLNPDLPLVPPRGRTIALTNSDIYDLIELP